MELLFVIGVIIVVIALFRPVTRTQTVYVPVEIQEVQSRGMGRLWLLIFVVLILLVSGVIQL